MSDSCIDSRACPVVTKDISEGRWFERLPFMSKSKVVCSNGHKNTSDRLIVKVTNWFFSLLAVLHLAYLGATFDGKEESSYFSNVLQVWSGLGFYSHILTVLTFLFYKLIGWSGQSSNSNISSYVCYLLLAAFVARLGPELYNYITLA